MSVSAAMAAVAGCATVLCAWELGRLAPWPRVAGGVRNLIALAGASTTVAGGPVPASVRLVALVSVVATGASWLLVGLGGAALAGVTVPVVVVVATRIRIRRQRRLAAADAPLVARAIADAVDGGHAIRSAVAAASQDGAVCGAAGAELRRLAHELQCGASTRDAVHAWACRLDDPTVNTIAAAIVLGREAGGDLGGVLRDVARAGDEAARARVEAASATAQARATARMVTGLPFGALALAEVAAPGYLTELVANPISGLLVVLALVLQAIAAVLVRRLSRVMT